MTLANKGLKVEKNRQGTLIKEVIIFEGNNMMFKETDESLKDITDTSLLVTPCSFRSFLIACDNSLFVMVLFSFRALSHQCR